MPTSAFLAAPVWVRQKHWHITAADPGSSGSDKTYGLPVFCINYRKMPTHHQELAFKWVHFKEICMAVSLSCMGRSVQSQNERQKRFFGEQRWSSYSVIGCTDFLDFWPETWNWSSLISQQCLHDEKMAFLRWASLCLFYIINTYQTRKRVRNFSFSSWG